MPPRPRSHSYTGPATAKTVPQEPPPFHPINSVISDERRAAHNLKVLQRHDPSIQAIHDQIPYAVIQLMKPRSGRSDEKSYWEHQLAGPEGPLFFVERESPSNHSKLGFAVLNTKDVFSWIQILQPDDEIEFSPEMAFIVPSCRKDVMWPAFLMKASDGLYAPYIIRLLARCHLLLRYGLEWPDRWKAGQGKLPETNLVDPVSASHQPVSHKPEKETDLLSMLVVGSRITEIERVAEEIVRVVMAGGTWCRNEFVPPENGWPADWEEPKGTTGDIWGRRLTKSRDPNADPITGIPKSSSLSDASTIRPGNSKTNGTSNGKKKASQQQRVLNPDVLSNLMQAPLKTGTSTLRPNTAPAATGEDDGRTPIPSDFTSQLPDTEDSHNNSQPSKGRRNKSKSKQGVENIVPGAGPDSSIGSSDGREPILRTTSSTPALRVGTPAFGIVDDRLSDDEEIEATTSQVRHTPVTVEKREGETEARGKKKKEAKRRPESMPKPPPLKYHEKGYIPQNSSDDTPALDSNVLRSVLSNGIAAEMKNYPVLERNDWVRELLQLIHTKKDFVDSIYGDYRAKMKQTE